MMRVVLLLLIWLMPAHAGSLRLITVIEPPVSYLDSHGKPIGFAIDVVRAIQQELDDHTPIEVMPEARAMYIAHNEANVVLFSFSRTAERENDFYWLSPLLQKSWSLYARADSRLQISSLEQLRTVKAIGVVRGDVREEWLVSHGFSNLHPSVNHQQNLSRLLAGRLDLIAYEGQGIQHLLQEEGLSVDKVRKVLELKRSDVYLMMSKLGTDPELAEQWRLAAEKIRRSGDKQLLAEKWQLQLKHYYDVETNTDDGMLIFN